MENKEYKNFHEFLLNESTVLEKKEDTNPLYYMWAVIMSANGKSDEEIKNDETLKNLFKRINKFNDSHDKLVKKLRDKYTPSEMLISFRDQGTDNQRKMIDYKLADMLHTMTCDVKGFTEWNEIQKDWADFVKSEEVQTFIASI